MKRSSSKKRKVAKGMPSAVLVSILIHAGLFLLAGTLVVFSVVKRNEVEFEPPKAVERPKMKLKKPKVKVKKSSKPKPTTRIVTKVQKASMPDIQLPEMSGMGEGLGGGIGGFDLMPDLGDVTIFGSGQSIGSDFVGTYYDSKLDRSGHTLSVDVEGFEWRALLNKFLRRDWDTSVFARYYRSPKKLYATNFVIPVMLSSAAPTAFGATESIGALWMAHYKGQLVYKDDITFRFWGMADEFMAVRVDGELVLAFDWPWQQLDHAIMGNLWESDSPDSRRFYMGNYLSVVGDWITLKAGEPLPMEILIGDNGGVACFFLAVEVKGVEYPKNRQGGPILPAFKTSEISHDLLDIIYNELPVEEICLTNGPVFRDYDLPAGSVAQDAAEPAPNAANPSVPEPAEEKTRTWILANGRTLEAEFVNVFGGKLVLRNAAGKTCKIPLGKLSAEDREYAELALPPTLDINFLNTFNTVRFEGGFYDVENWRRPPEQRGHYGVQIKQTSPGDYDHELKVEMFVVGQQRSRSNARHILLDHQETTFNPAREPHRFYEFRSDHEVVLQNYSIEYYGTDHGEKYTGHLVVVTDERGEVVAVKSSTKWLQNNLENLQRLSVGNYMDKSCIRTYPARPKTPHY